MSTAATTSPLASPLTGGALYRRLHGFVRAALRGLGVRGADIDDLAQDVFVTLHVKGCTFADERSARAWLYGAARRVASNARRARVRAARRIAGWDPTQPPAPDVAVQQREAAGAVSDFAAQLREPAREVFRLSEVQGMPAPEVADALGLKLNTTYSHIRRVRQRFARSVAIGVGLLLLLLAALSGTCTAEGTDDGDRIALRRGPHVAG